MTAVARLGAAARARGGWRDRGRSAPAAAPAPGGAARVPDEPSRGEGAPRPSSGRRPASAELAAAVLDGIAAVPRAAGPGAGVDRARASPGLRAARRSRSPISSTGPLHGVRGDLLRGAGSDYVQALAHAIDRGVAVTVIVDRGMQEKNGGVIPQRAGRCAGVGVRPRPGRGVRTSPTREARRRRRTAALVTSANFSDAAAKRNLECGLLSHDADVAEGLVRQLETLYRARRTGRLLTATLWVALSTACSRMYACAQ